MDENKIKLESPEIEPDDDGIKEPDITAEVMLFDGFVPDFEDDTDDNPWVIEGGEPDVYSE